MRLSFLGAAGTVTGSKYLLEGGGARILVDCGLSQELKELRLRNWESPPVDPRTLDAVVLTHAHLDHSGYLPRLVKEGFRGPVWCTPGTLGLARILLPDSAHLQEEDARFANQRGYSRHRPALPLYTLADAQAALGGIRTADYDGPFEIGGLRVCFTPAGHMLGSACVRVEDAHTNVVFSGDVGRPADSLFEPPRPLNDVRNLVVESTYGDRRHPASDPTAQLGEVVRRTVARGGVVMIPAFAVGRSQQILLQIARLKAAGEIPDVPVFLNSPMAIEAMRVFFEHPTEHRLTHDECAAMRDVAGWVRTPEESKKLNLRREPMILLAGSGMMTGGRILHHLVAFGPDPRNALLLVGYQAAGTRGRALDQGAESVKIHGEQVPIRAERVRIDGLSGHADHAELCAWLGSVREAPRRVFVTHGDPAAAEAFRGHLREELGWEAEVPRHGDEVELT